ncbi:MAG: GDYXXLXY domain-containing protein [Bacteroidota bacterium]
MKKTSILLLAATFLLQWWIPLNMIFQQETILKEGTAFKFQTEPIDPNDPFRGKYITLNYVIDRVEVTNGKSWVSGEPVFVQIEEDAKGFAKVKSLEKVTPTNDANYVKATIRGVYGGNPTMVNLQYPFERFYMEESKAPKAEALFRDLWRDSTTQVYGLVIIKDGRAALEDVLVDEISIREAVENVD